MVSRRPAGSGEATLGRAASALARGGTDRHEPTRPTGVRRRRPERESRGPLRPFLRALNGILTFILLLMLIATGIAFAVNSQLDAPGPLEKSRVLVVAKGDGAVEIGARLEREGVVSDRRLFVAGYLLTKFTAWLGGGKPVQIKAGDFEVVEAASVRHVVEVLTEGRTVSYKVTIPEGLTSFQIVERLKADPNLSGEIAQVPAEGTLLPETFVVQRGTARQAVLDLMAAESRKVLDRLWEARKADLPLKSIGEAVVLASIVEKETGRNDERERVAAVFVNRLRLNMRLQSDPTILYGLFGGKTVWGKPILRSEKAQKTQHNTYEIDGLPPTPICNPGRAAIEATLNPADTKELYFVANGSGGHTFSETLKEHNAGVQKWRAVEKEMRARRDAADTPQPVDKGKKGRAAAAAGDDKGAPIQPKRINSVPDAKADKGQEKAGDKSGWSANTAPAKAKPAPAQ
ncbi:MAG: endolytic transglycosylase MltG [Hyphomicrobiaceae bacterium]|nr:endolytic transglycosylase MltG [Hyphomicrobiaceae bacterium]